MTVLRNIGGKDADLAIGDLARRAGILTRDTARGLALLEKTGLVDHQHRILGTEHLNDRVVHDISQGVGIPPTLAEDRLLPLRTRIAGRFGAHPTLHIAQR